MIATFAIYALALIVFGAIGLACLSLLFPGRNPIQIEAIPLGLALLVTVSYPIALVIPMRIGTWVQLALVLILAAVAVTLGARREHIRSAREGFGRVSSAVRARVGDITTAAVAIAAGVVFLWPVLEIGFPTTVAITNNDGWTYAGFIIWLEDHTLLQASTAGPEDPLAIWPARQIEDGFGVGLELTGGLVATVLNRLTFEVIGPVTAAGVPVAIAGWASLWKAVAGRVSSLQGALISVAAFSPLFVLPFAENFGPQFFGLTLWPFALAATYRYAREAGWRNLVVAAIAVSGVIGIYPGLAPWLAAGVVPAAILGAAFFREDGGLRERGVTAARRSVVALGTVALAVLVVAPYQVNQVRIFIEIHNGVAGVPFPFFSPERYFVFGLGATSPFPTGENTIPTSDLISAAIVGAIAAAAIGWAVVNRNRVSLTMILLGAPLVLATSYVAWRFSVDDDQGYGVYKALISGGSMIAGLLVLLVAPRSTSGPMTWVRVVGIALLAFAWIPQSLEYLRDARDSTPGFRATDIAMGRTLAGLDDGLVLVEGAAQDGPGSFQLRMMSSYFLAGYTDHDFEGLASTYSYVAPGGELDQRPDRPWDYVLTSAEQPIVSRREELWTNGAYTIEQATGDLDVTLYGNGWFATEGEGEGAFAWTNREQGEIDFIVANRTDEPTQALLSFDATSWGQPRDIVVWVNGEQQAPQRIEAEGKTQVSVPLKVPADSTRVVGLDVYPGASPAPDPDPRSLSLQISGVNVTAIEAAEEPEFTPQTRPLIAG